MSEKIKKRCAIYTRKSHEDGLDKEFNSLEAQREAGEDKIRSQKHEGWVAIPEIYEDGGITGATMERPGLQKLLRHMEEGLIDVVVVYKIDRLSRSMLDFLSMIKFFDEHNVSFVSVTQDFNTDTPMGRLMLNVLQSFAQFEREVTAERIRDKIAASKKRGMWMGGTPPLGYNACNRSLEINPDEAEIACFIFTRFISLRSTTLLVRELKEKGYKNKSWVSQKGRFHGGNDFCKSVIYRILNNPLYLGKISHKGTIHEGRHDAITVSLRTCQFMRGEVPHDLKRICHDYCRRHKLGCQCSGYGTDNRDCLRHLSDSPGTQSLQKRKTDQPLITGRSNRTACANAERFTAPRIEQAYVSAPRLQGADPGNTVLFSHAFGKLTYAAERRNQLKRLFAGFIAAKRPRQIRAGDRLDNIAGKQAAIIPAPFKGHVLHTRHLGSQSLRPVFFSFEH